MTGKDLIIYILDQNLENKILFDDKNNLIGYISAEKASTEYNTNIETIKMLYERNIIRGFTIDDSLYILIDDLMSINLKKEEEE